MDYSEYIYHDPDFLDEYVINENDNIISEKLNKILSPSNIYSMIIENEIENENEARSETMLDELRPSHAEGITNAHLGNRTTDPFDLQRDDLLFRC